MARELTDKERFVLRRLVDCKPGLGLMLDDSNKRYVGILLRRGFVEWIEGGGVRVYKVNDEGRAAWKEMLKPHTLECR